MESETESGIRGETKIKRMTRPRRETLSLARTRKRQKIRRYPGGETRSARDADQGR